MEKWIEKFPQDLQQKVAEVDQMIAPQLAAVDETVLYNQQRILDLYRKHHVAEEDLVGSTGYGYDDLGRDKLEDIFADYFKCDDALVRPQWFLNACNFNGVICIVNARRYFILHDRNAV